SSYIAVGSVSGSSGTPGGGVSFDLDEPIDVGSPLPAGARGAGMDDVGEDVAVGGTGGTPGASSGWNVLAQKGDTGATGATGAQGTPGSQGAKGDTGATGATGPQ